MNDLYKNLLIAFLLGLSIVLIMMQKACHGSPMMLSGEELSDSSLIVSRRASMTNPDIDVKLARLLFFKESFSSQAALERQDEELGTLTSLILTESQRSSSSLSLVRIEGLERQDETRSSRWKNVKKSMAVVGGCAAGAALTPIFLQSLETIADSLGNPLEENSTASVAIRYGTMALLIGDNVFNNLCIVADERKHFKGQYHWIGKSVLLASSLLPVAFLWNVESAHQRSAGSTGFDTYMTVFSLGSVPLLMSSYLHERHTAFEMSQEEMPLTRKEKAFAYGVPLFNTLARGILAYTLFNQALGTVSDEEAVNQSLSIVVGCLAANAMGIFQEINGLKSLVYQHRERESQSLKGMIKNTGLLVINAYKSLPSAAVIFYGMTGGSKSLRSTLSAQLFLSNTFSSTGNALSLMKKRT